MHATPGSAGNAGRTSLDALRAAALARVEKRDRAYRTAILLAALVEGALLVTFILLADFHNRLHTLLLLSSMLVYCTLALGLVALGAHVSRVAERLLMAIEVADEG